VAPSLQKITTDKKIHDKTCIRERRPIVYFSIQSTLARIKSTCSAKH
jgi:hypothetical protein